jgi:hypothetical protein
VRRHGANRFRDRTFRSARKFVLRVPGGLADCCFAQQGGWDCSSAAESKYVRPLTADMHLHWPFIRSVFSVGL